jgi:hypothetical protein
MTCHPRRFLRRTNSTKSPQLLPDHGDKIFPIDAHRSRFELAEFFLLLLNSQPDSTDHTPFLPSPEIHFLLHVQHLAHPYFRLVYRRYRQSEFRQRETNPHKQKQKETAAVNPRVLHTVTQFSLFVIVSRTMRHSALPVRRRAADGLRIPALYPPSVSSPALHARSEFPAPLLTLRLLHARHCASRFGSRLLSYPGIKPLGSPSFGRSPAFDLTLLFFFPSNLRGLSSCLLRRRECRVSGSLEDFQSWDCGGALVGLRW